MTPFRKSQFQCSAGFQFNVCVNVLDESGTWVLLPPLFLIGCANYRGHLISLDLRLFSLTLGMMNFALPTAQGFM